MGAYFLGAIIGKILGLAGLGSLLSGLFVKNQKLLILFIIFFAFIDTFILCQLNPVCRFERSFIFALIGATIVGYLTYLIKNRKKSK
ncbi:hypothetical protein OAM73_04305 [Candidatus Pelagibacter sp.]|jgi:hypothetical protein|nr:hypothetical protein [Candidatus Pelagibacter sp.]